MIAPPLLFDASAIHEISQLRLDKQETEAGREADEREMRTDEKAMPGNTGRVRTLAGKKRVPGPCP
jgi:hypothetical protein